MSLLLSLSVFAFTLYLVIVRPRNLNIALSAGLGAVAALLLGLMHWADVTAQRVNVRRLSAGLLAGWSQPRLGWLGHRVRRPAAGFPD